MPDRNALNLRQSRRRAGRNPARTASGRGIAGLWDWAERLVLMATFVSIIFGVWVYREERQTRREEAINRAWSLLTTPATGNSGKRAALEYLAGQGVSLRGIDLSCARMGGGWDAEALSCRAPVDLTGLRLRGPNGEGVDLRLSRLDGVDLTGADLEDAQMGGAGLAGATLSGARLRGAQMIGVQAPGARLDGADLRAAVLSLGKLRGADLDGADLGAAVLISADLTGAHVSDTNFGAATLTYSDLPALWAMADRPPKGLAGPVTLCARDRPMAESQRRLLGAP